MPSGAKGRARPSPSIGRPLPRGPGYPAALGHAAADGPHAPVFIETIAAPALLAPAARLPRPWGRWATQLAFALLAVTSLGACGHAGTLSPVPRDERLIVAPAVEPLSPDPVGLGHLLRGLYLLHTDQLETSVAELRLALMYDGHSPYLHERLASAYLMTEQADAAAEMLRKGLHDAPQDSGLNLLAGQLALEDWHYDDAMGHLEHALDDPALLSMAAGPYLDALLWGGHAERALARAQSLMEEHPADVDLCVAVAGALEDHAQLQPALDAYRRARAQAPSDRYAALGEMRVHLLLGDVTAAADCLQPLLAFYPDQPELYVQLARLLVEARRPGAEAYRKEALRQTEGDASGRLSVAAGDLLVGQGERALAVAREALQADPKSAEVQIFMADLQRQRGDAGGALALLRDGADVPGVHRARARALAAQGRADAVLGEMAQAVAHAPSPSDAALAVGDAVRWVLAAEAQRPPKATRAKLTAWLQRQKPALGGEAWPLAQASLEDAWGDAERALKLLLPLADNHPDDLAVQLRVADLQARAGWVQDAVDGLQELLRADPYDAVRLNALGYTLMEAEPQGRAAAVWIRRAFRLAPEDGYIIDSLGWMLLHQGQPAQAAVWLGRAHAANPEDPEILRHLADALRAAGQGQEAKAAYAQALTLGPTGALRKLLLQRLGRAP